MQVQPSTTPPSRRTILMLGALATLCLSLARAQQPASHARGYFEKVKLDSYYPGFSYLHFMNRIGETGGGPGEMVPADRMQISLFVPPSYRPGLPHGLLFIVPTRDTAKETALPKWATDAAAKHHLIIARAPELNVPKGSYDFRRTVTAVCTPLFLDQHYTLDWERTYVYGGDTHMFSGEYALLCGLGFPEIYQGVIGDAQLGRWSPEAKLEDFDDVDLRTGKPQKRQVGKSHNPPKPDAERLAYMQKHTRLVFRDMVDNRMAENYATFYDEQGIRYKAFVAGGPRKQKGLADEIHDIIDFLDAPLREDAQAIESQAKDLMADHKYGDALRLAYRADALGERRAKPLIEKLEAIRDEQIARARRDIDGGDVDKGRRRLEKVVDFFGDTALDAQRLLDGDDETAAAPPVGDAQPPGAGRELPEPRREKIRDTIKPHTTGLKQYVKFGQAPLELIDTQAYRKRTGIVDQVDSDAMKAAAFGMEYLIIVPETYKPGVPHALVIGTQLDSNYVGVEGIYPGLEKSRVIYVTPQRRLEKVPYAEYFYITAVFNALHNMRRLYTIDPQRIYLYTKRGDHKTTVGDNVFRELDVGTRLAFYYPEHFSGLFHTGYMPYWEDIDRHDAELARLTRAEQEAARHIRFRFYSDNRRGDSFDEYVDKLARELRRDKFDADTGTYTTINSGAYPNWGEIMPDAEKPLQEEAARAQSLGPAAEEKGDYETALLLWYRAQLYDVRGADDEIARLRGILDTQTRKARELIADGDARKGQRLARKIVDVFGIFATDAAAMIADD